jgi:sirohydrochlorin ferrochelatase
MTPLVLAAHGSTDPRFADVVSSLASLVVASRPQLDVRVGYLEHGTSLAQVSDPDCVVVPLLLTNGYHAHIDIPTQAPASVIAAPLGPDYRLALVLADRLREAGWRGGPVVLAAAGSADERALQDARRAAADLSCVLGVAVTAAFIGSGEPRLDTAAAVATYLIAPGKFADLAAATGVIAAAPLGADPRIAEIILDRYDRALTRPARARNPSPSSTLKAV